MNRSLANIVSKQIIIPRKRCLSSSPIDLEMLDLDLFRSISLWRPSGARAVYGGQVVGQALAASRNCVEKGKDLHSMHSYFMKGGDPDTPILYRVRRLNITNNFEVHSISAKQKGETIFSCQASYHKKEESSLFHERVMPKAPNPETLLSSTEILHKYLVDSRTSDRYKALILETLKTPFPIDVREVNPVDFFSPDKREEARKLVWMKALIPVATDDINMHKCIAAYESDWGLGVSSLLPHGISFPSPKLKIVTSLDHSMWFHSSFRADDWLLFDMQSIKLAGGRGMNLGYIYNRQGELAITTMQETLIRLNRPKSEHVSKEK